MSGYTPLFSSIIASTIWRESKETKIVWITMLAMADARGIVEASIPGLADFAKVTIEECKTALECLTSPDEYSRTEAHQGRRIDKIDGGWRILNHAAYRDKCRQRADYMRDYRAKKAECNHNVTNVTACNHMLPPVTESDSTHTQTQTQHKQDIKNKNCSLEVNDGCIEGVHIPKWEDEFKTAWSMYPDKSGKALAKKSFKKAYDEGTRLADVVAGLDRYARYIIARRSGKNGFKNLQVKNGGTWFHNRCWQDEYTMEDTEANNGMPKFD